MRTILTIHRTILTWLAFLGLAFAIPALAQVKVAFDLPEQPLAESIRAIGQKAGMNILFDPALTNGKRAQPVKGQLTAEEALAKALANTDLAVQKVRDGTISIVARSKQADLASRSPALAAAGRDDQGGMPQEKITVTARKRAEALADVPAPVSAVSSSRLLESNQLRLQDYYTRIPGLSLIPTGNSNAPTLVVRGIATGGYSNPTTSILVDEVAYGSSTSFGPAPTAPDIDPNDLARVEVLRGPQGTLYGASALGGLVKFVTIDPSTDRFSGRLQAGLSTVSHGNDLGYNLRGSANVPVSETFAVRASGFTTRDSGYIDNVKTQEEDVNRTDNRGGRLAALWRPSGLFSLKLSALFQESERSGVDQVDKSLGADDLNQSFLPGTGELSRRSQAYTATMNAALGKVDLISVTGYTKDRLASNIDLGPFAAGLYANLANTNFGVRGASEPLTNRLEKVSQEVRLMIPIAQRIEWQVGGYYAHEKGASVADFQATNPVTGDRVGALLKLNDSMTFEEYAGFTNVTFDLSDRFDVQVGGRLSRNKQERNPSTRSGPLVAVFFGGVTSVPGTRSEDDSFTYLITPRFRMSSDMMLYARLASGYRPGSSNVNCGAPGVPCTFDPDTTQNYEVGLKGDVLGRMLFVDASLYRIDWKDIQQTVRDPVSNVLTYIVNAGKAKSQGVELSIVSRPLPGMTLTAWGAYNDAELTNVPPTNTCAACLGGAAGERLPYSSRLSGSLSVDQEFPLGSMTATLGASASYVGDRYGQFRATGRETYPAYTQGDLRAGLRFQSWTLNAFVNNVTDKRGVLRGGLDSFGANFVTYIRPRSFGISLSKVI
jgi:iron complex outermembrane recepter protein